MRMARERLFGRKLLELRGLMYELICILGGLSNWACIEDVEGTRGGTGVEVILASSQTRDGPKKRRFHQSYKRLYSTAGTPMVPEY